MLKFRLPTKGKLAQSNGQQPEQQNSFEKKLKKKKASKWALAGQVNFRDDQYLGDSR